MGGKTRGSWGGRGGLPVLYAEDNKSVRSELAGDVGVTNDACKRLLTKGREVRLPVHVERLAPRPWEKIMAGNCPSIGEASG